jgi:hypothetical protein
MSADTRAERKAKLAEQAAAQKAIDLEAIDALEVEHGDSNIAVVEVPYTPGLPVLAAAKVPPEAYLKRYRARLKEDVKNAPEAAEEVADACCVYPDPEVRKALFAARGGLRVQLGGAAIKLATGREESEGKG